MAKHSGVTKGELEMRLEAVSKFADRYARHDDQCRALTGNGNCDCGYNHMLARVQVAYGKPCVEVHPVQQSQAMVK